MKCVVAVFVLIATVATPVISSEFRDAEGRVISSYVHQLQTVRRINSDPDSTWQAMIYPRFSTMHYDKIKRLMGVNRQVKKAELPAKQHTVNEDEIPVEFDARKKWPQCKSISQISDQSDCGSCWAESSATVATDRLCIATDGALTEPLSVVDLLSCCSICGFGCQGGQPSQAFYYMTSEGLVTGGSYHNYKYCASYPFPPCNHHTAGRYENCTALGGDFETPTCPTQCDKESDYKTSFNKDKHVFATAYSIDSAVEQIQTELMRNGPISVAFTVYDDFLTYRSGVYQHKSEEEMGGHAVRLIGWGVDSGVDYWLVANSWNEDWGEHGTFKILRGRDECGIESEAVAGLWKTTPTEQIEEETVAEWRPELPVEEEVELKQAEPVLPELPEVVDM